MGKKFEKAREYLGGVAGGTWLVSDFANGGRDFLETQANAFIPYSNTAAAVALFIANIYFLAGGKNPKYVAIGQALSAPAATLMTMSALSTGNFVSATALGIITVGCTMSGLKANKQYQEQKKKKQVAATPEKKTETISPIVEFKENKQGFFEKYPQMKPNILTMTGNSIFLTGALLEMEKAPTPAHKLAVTVASLWVFGAACLGFSKQVDKTLSPASP